MAEVKEYYVPTGLSMHSPEELIGSQHRDLLAIYRGMPVGIVAIEQDDVPRSEKIGVQHYSVQVPFRDLDLSCRWIPAFAGMTRWAVDGRRILEVHVFSLPSSLARRYKRADQRRGSGNP